MAVGIDVDGIGKASVPFTELESVIEPFRSSEVDDEGASSMVMYSRTSLKKMPRQMPNFIIFIIIFFF